VTEMHGAVRRAVGALAGLAVAPATISHSASRSWIRAFAALPDAGTSGSMARNVTARPPGAAGPCDVTLGIPEVGGGGARAWGGLDAGDVGRVQGDGVFALMAVPKRKVTPSRRKRRNQFKRIKFIADATRCRDCGKAKMPHVYCDQCSTNMFDDMLGVGKPSPGS